MDGFKEVLWSDDGDTDGHSLRSGTITCTAPAAQTVTFTSTAPTSPVVGQTYGPTATGGASGQPVELSASPSDVCTISGAKVTFDHAGTCKVKADQSAAPGYLAGTATQQIVVGRASTATVVSVSASSVTAKVETVAPGVGNATGDVEFMVGSDVIGTAALVNGEATLAAVVSAGGDRVVKAVYAGNADFVSSTDSLTRRDPLITATLDGTKSTSGWYVSPVTVTFVCTPKGAPLVGECPAPVTLTNDGAAQSASANVSATDGGSATASVEGIRIDRTAPKVTITGVTKEKLYVGSLPKPKCVATDATSGVASCALTRKVTATRTTVTAKAVDNAGNRSTTSLSYRTLAYTVRGASYRGGEFRLKAGKSYRLDGTVKASGRVYGPGKIGRTAEYSGRLKGGKATVKVPGSARTGSHWKVVVKVGSKTYTVKLKVVS